MKNSNSLIAKINHTEQSVEWEILRDIYKANHVTEVMDRYYKNRIGDFYLLVKPSVATDKSTDALIDICHALSIYGFKNGEWNISIFRHKNRLYLLHVIRLNIHQTEWFDNDGESRVSELSDICAVYARSISTSNVAETIININKLATSNTKRLNKPLVSNRGFKQFTIDIGLEALEEIKTNLRKHLNTTNDEDATFLVGTVSINESEKLSSLNVCKNWWSRLVSFVKPEITQNQHQ